MRGILFDLDGVFYEGDRAIDGGADTVAWVEQQHIPYRFVTNTTSKPRSALVAKLQTMGIATDEDHILTPSVAARDWIHRHGRVPVALFVPEATSAEFSGLESLPTDRETGAAAVVVGDLGEAWDFATLNRAFRLLMADPPPALLALGMTRYWRATDGLRLDAAPFIVALQHASGVEPLVLGKPAAAFFQAGADALGLKPAQCVMVGDDIRGDVAGAQSAGMMGVQVRTGKFRPSDLEAGIKPDQVLGSIVDLPEWWSRQER